MQHVCSSRRVLGTLPANAVRSPPPQNATTKRGRRSASLGLLFRPHHEARYPASAAHFIAQRIDSARQLVSAAIRASNSRRDSRTRVSPPPALRDRRGPRAESGPDFAHSQQATRPRRHRDDRFKARPCSTRAGASLGGRTWCTSATRGNIQQLQSRGDPTITRSDSIVCAHRNSVRTLARA